MEKIMRRETLGSLGTVLQKNGMKFDKDKLQGYQAEKHFSG